MFIIRKVGNEMKEEYRNEDKEEKRKKSESSIALLVTQTKWQAN